MPIYIDAGALLLQMNRRYEELKEQYTQYDSYVSGYEEALNRLEECEAEEVMPVRHGQWEQHPTKGGWARCSHCKNVRLSFTRSDRDDWEYCPSCGTKMDIVPAWYWPVKEDE